MKICIFSNSHGAALKLGADCLPAMFKPRFVVAPTKAISNLNLMGSTLSCDDSDNRNDIAFSYGGDGTIDLAEHDIFVVHGLGFRYFYELHENGFYSEAFISAFHNERWKKSLFVRLIEKIRLASNQPIIISPRPYISEADTATRDIVAASGIATQGLPIFRPKFILANPHAIYYLGQPSKTICNKIFTNHEFCRESTALQSSKHRAQVRHSEQDLVHMNANYGKAYWESFVDLLHTSIAMKTAAD